MYVIYKDYDLPEINFVFNGSSALLNIITVNFSKKTYLVICQLTILFYAEKNSI